MILGLGLRNPFPDEQSRFEAGWLGMVVFLASLAMLFAASIIGFIVIRTRDLAWPESLPSLPSVLWISTVVLLVSSVTFQAAINGIRRSDQAALKRWLAVTLALAGLFLLLQAVGWWSWREALAASSADDEAQVFAMSAFYVLTGVHALHVIGGLVPMIVVMVLACRDVYSAGHHPGVVYCAMYWHFLDAVWIALFMTLLVGV